MTHFSENPGKVRVDYYKLGGKWYMTEAVDMQHHYDDTDIHRAVRESIIQHAMTHPRSLTREEAEAFVDRWLIVVAEPYHKNAYPIVLMPEAMRQMANAL